MRTANEPARRGEFREDPSSAPPVHSSRSGAHDIGGKRQDVFFAKVAVACDAAVIVASYLMAYELRDRYLGHWYGPLFALSSYLWIVWCILPIWLLIGKWFRLHSPATYSTVGTLLGAHTRAHVLSGLLLLSTMFVSGAWAVSRLLLQTFIAVSFVALLAERLVVRRWLRSLANGVSRGCRNVLLVGTDSPVVRFAAKAWESLHWQERIVGHLSRESSSAHSAPVLGNRLGDPAALSSVLRSEVVDEVIASSALGATELRTLAKIAAEFGVRFRTLVEIPESVIGSFQVEVLGDGLCVLSQERTAHGPLQEAVKRMLDVAGSVLGLAVCGVVCAWYVPRLRKESPGPVFFAQERVGRNGRTFTLYKFRTMYPDADKDLDKLRGRNQMSGFVFKLRDDPRVTPTGRKLRRTHLDELPQFWNVLRGDMSIVGSRPPTREEVEQYEPKHRRRLSIKPGITGLWQIAGNARVNDFDTIVALDCEYIENWSFWLDFRIIARTMIKILRAEGW